MVLNTRFAKNGFNTPKKINAVQGQFLLNLQKTKMETLLQCRNWVIANKETVVSFPHLRLIPLLEKVIVISNLRGR